MGCFVVARRDGPEMLEFGEEVLDQMTRLSEIFVIVALERAVAFGRHDSVLARLLQGLEDPLLGILGFLGHDRVGLKVRHQGIRAIQVAGLSRRQVKAGRSAQPIGRGMKLGAQATLVLKPP